ncbi:hypothetical protein [Hymenobacter tenuis]
MRVAIVILSGLLLGVFSGCHFDSEQQALRLKLVDDMLVHSNEAAVKENARGLIGAEELVLRSQRQKDVVLLYEKCADIQRKLATRISLLRYVRERLLRASEGESHARKLLDSDAPTNMLEQPTNALIDSVYTQLLLFTQELHPYLPAKYQHLLKNKTTPEAWPFVLGATSSEYKAIYWQDTSTAEALAALAQQEAQIIALARDALNVQHANLKSSHHRFRGFGNIIAHAVPETNLVTEGDIYKAKLFLAAPAYGEAIRMMANGKPLEIDADGYGYVEFTASAPKANRSKEVTMHWNGSVVRSYQGYITTYPIRVPYTVRRK